MQEQHVLEHYIHESGLKNTPQRYKVLEVFLALEDHLSVDELYEAVHKRYPEIGHSTVFRTMKIIHDAGLAKTIRNQQGVVKYEHAYNHKEHEHLICSNCGKLIEVSVPQLDNIQRDIASKYDFEVVEHVFKLIGLCSVCKKERVRK